MILFALPFPDSGDVVDTGAAMEKVITCIVTSVPQFPPKETQSIYTDRDVKTWGCDFSRKSVTLRFARRQGSKSSAVVCKQILRQILTERHGPTEILPFVDAQASLH